MAEATPVIKQGPTKIQIIDEQIKQLEDEIMALGNSVSESQIKYKKDAIERLKAQREEENAKKLKGFNNAKMGMQAEMAQKDMMAAMAQGDRSA